MKNLNLTLLGQVIVNRLGEEAASAFIMAILSVQLIKVNYLIISCFCLNV